MNEEVIQLLLSIHHQLATDADLDVITGAEKYRDLLLRIESVLLRTEYAYICTRTAWLESAGA